VLLYQGLRWAWLIFFIPGKGSTDYQGGKLEGKLLASGRLQVNSPGNFSQPGFTVGGWVYLDFQVSRLARFDGEISVGDRRTTHRHPEPIGDFIALHEASSGAHSCSAYFCNETGTIRLQLETGGYRAVVYLYLAEIERRGAGAQFTTLTATRKHQPERSCHQQENKTNNNY
jgi:hypothetical protein